jgi:PKD repeat protein
MSVNSTTGTAPLALNFDGSSSRELDPGQSIASYVFDFGDGAVISQANPKISHTYTKAGIYKAKLKVVDTRGGVSGNSVQMTITVLAAPKLR